MRWRRNGGAAPAGPLPGQAPITGNRSPGTARADHPGWLVVRSRLLARKPPAASGGSKSRRLMSAAPHVSPRPVGNADPGNGRGRDPEAAAAERSARDAQLERGDTPLADT